jgi:hypothetical protein
LILILRDELCIIYIHIFGGHPRRPEGSIDVGSLSTIPLFQLVRSKESLKLIASRAFSKLYLLLCVFLQEPLDCGPDNVE